ncbi:MAG: LCP family protein [Cyanobacteria bacterium]|nr:LCP family protein [Cyanobacteriota bacterium]
MARRSDPTQLRRGPALLRLSAAAVGMVMGAISIGVFWPSRDQGNQPLQQLTPADLAKRPSRSITLLVIGLDSERPGDPLNKAAPPGAANADALLLVRVNPQGPLQVLSLPPNLAVQLPGQKRPQGLGSLYRVGGVALTADAARNLVRLESGQPERFLVLGRSSLRNLVDGLGSIAVNPTQALRYEDKSQRFSINLQGGLQRLKGNQIEQLVRYRDPNRPEESRQDHQQLVVGSLLRELALPERLGELAKLLQSLNNEGVVTNLSQPETLSLLAAGLDQAESVQFTSMPLKPATSGLREISNSAPEPLWPAPATSTGQ